MNKLFDHLVVVALTAMPGLQRVLAIWLIARISGVEILGRVASDLGVIAIIGSFTAIGWSAVLMIRLPRIRPTRQVQMFLGILLRAGMLNLLASPILWGLAIYGIVFSWMGSALYLGSWSGYQLVRHYGLAKKLYVPLLIVDTLCTTMTILMLLFSANDELWVYTALSLPPLAVTIVLLLHSLYKTRLNGLNAFTQLRDVWRSSQGLGLSNAMTGSLGAAMTPLIRFAAGDMYAGVMAIIQSIVSALLLFPRALSFQQLVPLTQAVGKRDWTAVRTRIRDFRRHVLIILLLLSVVISIAWFAGIYRVYMLDETVQFLHLAFLVSLAGFFVSQLVLPEANLLTALEEIGAKMKVNFFSMASFIAGIVFIVNMNATNEIAFIRLLFAYFFSICVVSVGTVYISNKILIRFT